MTRRYSCKAAAVATGGTTFTHGLTVRGVATAPDEWFFNHRTAPGAAGSGLVYMSGAPGATTFILSTVGATAQVDTFCSINHSIVK